MYMCVYVLGLQRWLCWVTCELKMRLEHKSEGDLGPLNQGMEISSRC